MRSVADFDVLRWRLLVARRVKPSDARTPVRQVLLLQSFNRGNAGPSTT